MPDLFDPVRGTSEPDRLWCITNVSEATPDILSPLCWSVWGAAMEDAWLTAMCSFGVISQPEAVRSPNPNHHSTMAIYGRQAMNVDAVLELVARMPGVDLDDFERDILGRVREHAVRPSGARRRLPFILLRLPTAMLTASRRLQARYAEIERWWQNEVFAGPSNQRSALERIRHGQAQFRRAMTVHLSVRLQLQAIQGALRDAAAKTGDPNLATSAISGQGNVTEVGLADDLWQMAHGQLAEADFLRRHGFHGPNEGNVYTRSWREEPQRVRALAESMSVRGDMERPRDREKRAMAAGAAAQRELLRASSAPTRPVLRFLLRRARNVVANLEIGKSAYLMGLDGARAAARDLGTSLVRAGKLQEIDDVFFLTLDELAQLETESLSNAADLVSYRRTTREEYRAMVLPASFTGMPAAEIIGRTEAAAAPDTVTGAASGGGTVTGRARVVLDPNDDVYLEPGDILVCRFTDPSWAPLFTMAEALVIDLGSAASHGAVVARELGLPYVIGTQDGTRRIHEGDVITVDGGGNSVRVVERRVSPGVPA
jgi:phosphohistidine swiveling domain-containing protein